MTVREYNVLLSIHNNWSVKEATIEYLEKDIIYLYQIVEKMSDIIFNKYKVNITNYSTISGLTMAIYRSNYLEPQFKLAHTTGSVEKTIRSAYYGGRTETFIPYGENSVSYDYNSLYPQLC